MARIIFLCERIISNFGVDRTVINIANELSKRNQVSVITSKFSSSSQEMRVKIEHIDLSYVTFLDFWEIDRQYSEKAYTIIESQLSKN